MPFLSDNQRKYCWVKYNQDIRNGKKPSWDCNEWEKNTPKNIKRSLRKSTNKSKSFSNSRLTDMTKYSRTKMRSLISKKRKIYTGTRGGKYVIVKGKKIYV